MTRVKTAFTREDVIYLYEERAGILEYCNGVARSEAEEFSLKLIEEELGERAAKIIRDYLNHDN